MTRFHTGQKIRAWPDQTWNRLVDKSQLPEGLRDGPLARDLSELIAKTRPGQLAIEVCPDFDMVEHGVAIIDQPTFQPPLLGLSDLGGEETLKPPMVDVVAPTGGNLGGVPIITLEPIAADNTGLAVVRGLSFARVDIQAAGDTVCGPASGDAEQLQSGGGSITIVWRERPGETGPMWCLVLFDSSSSSFPIACEFVCGSYDAGTNLITTSSTPTALPSSTPPVASGVKIYDPTDRDGWIPGEKGWAFYLAGVHADSDWLAFPYMRCRSFSVPARKLTTDASASVDWLSPNLVDTTYNGTVYDPHAKYAIPAGGKGIAALKQGPVTNTMRWEIVQAEQWPRYVCGALLADLAVGATVSMNVATSFGVEWEFTSGALGSSVDVTTCVQALDNGTLVMAVLKDPDTTPVLYQVVEAEGVTSIGDPSTWPFDPTYFTWDEEEEYWTLVTTTQLVLTGCASPNFVTFDTSGNPSWNFTAATITVLATAPASNVVCSATGTTDCTT